MLGEDVEEILGGGGVLGTIAVVGGYGGGAEDGLYA